jgi:hypothetical protein
MVNMTYLPLKMPQKGKKFYMQVISRNILSLVF